MAAVPEEERKMRAGARKALLEAITAQADLIKGFDGGVYAEDLEHLARAYAQVVTPSTGEPSRMYSA